MLREERDWCKARGGRFFREGALGRWLPWPNPRVLGDSLTRTPWAHHLPPPLVFIGVRAMPRVGERGSEPWVSLGLSNCSPAGRVGCGELSTWQNQRLKQVWTLTLLPFQVSSPRLIFQAGMARALRHSAYPNWIKKAENKASNYREEEGVRAFSESG